MSILRRPAMALLAGLLIVTAARPASSRELVIASELLHDSGSHLDEYLGQFLHRVEEVTGWPKGSLKGKAFARPADALDYIKKHRTAFAILPVHQVAEGHKPLKLEVLGRAVGLDGTLIAWVGLTRRPKPFESLTNTPGLRLATVDTYDPVWITILTEGALDPNQRAVGMLTTATSADALQAVLDKKAELAVVNELEWRAVKPRTEPGNDLEWVFNSPNLPPPAVVAVDSFASAADKKTLTDSLGQICKGAGGPACGRVGIQFVEPGRADTYDRVIGAYEELKGATAKRTARR